MSELIFRIVLVEPKYEGNIGSIARVMKNMGFSDLVIVNSPVLEDFARAMASHAYDLLEKSRKVNTLKEATEDASLVVGTTGVKSTKYTEFARRPAFTPEQLRKKLEGKKGTIALLFGREDTGLVNEVIEKCDIVVNIPAEPEYPVMNLAQAVAVVLYELSGIESGEVELAFHESLEQMYEHLGQLLDEVDYPEHKKRRTMMMLRRICGRAELSEREVFNIRGILRRVIWALKHKDKNKETNNF